MIDEEELNQISNQISNNISKEMYYLLRRIDFLKCLLSNSRKNKFDLLEDVIEFNNFIVSLLSTKNMDVDDLLKELHPYCSIQYNYPNHFDSEIAAVDTNKKKRKSKNDRTST